MSENAALVLAEACARMTPTSLDQVLEVADLQTRVDRKYLVPAAEFRALSGRLGDDLCVLSIEGRRMFNYESVYFDTLDLRTYRAHAHGRRRRFKVRTRSYLDSEQTVLEVKSQGGRGETVKDRYPHPVAERYTLDPSVRAIVAQRIGNDALAQQLQTSLVICYKRGTFIDYHDGSRLTCDVELAFREGRKERRGPDDLILVESKTTGARATADRLLWSMGHRPVSISKYCAGVALLNPHLPANRWNRVLRDTFGWERDYRHHQGAGRPAG